MFFKRTRVESTQMHLLGWFYGNFLEFLRFGDRKGNLWEFYIKFQHTRYVEGAL